MSSQRVLLITGASSGIGAATARAAVASGLRVVVAGRTLSKLEALAESLGGEVAAIPVRCDVTEHAEQEAMVKRALSHFGRIDAVFANAGIGGPHGFLQGTPEQIRTMILTNVLGVANTIRATLPALRATCGHLILTSSLAGRKARAGSIYGCTKAAVSAMGEAARLELVGTGIRVTVIEPGVTATPFFERKPAIALEADDIARAILYVLSQPPRVDVNQLLIRPTGQEI